MRIIRIGAFAFAFWMIGVGILTIVASLGDPMPELMPHAGLMGIVLGVLILLALWAFPFSGRRGRAYGDDDD